MYFRHLFLKEILRFTWVLKIFKYEHYSVNGLILRSLIMVR